jgi:transposase InsO family protein
MCALAGVSRAGYYRHWQTSRPRQEETALRDRVQCLALANRHYGYRRLTAELKREGWAINHKRVLRIAREDNLLCLRRRAFVPQTTQSDHRYKVYPNLARRLEPTAPNQLWVADITYIRLDEAFIYLAVILDAFSRKVIGWALDNHLKASLALEALRMALANRTVIAGALIHHSDRGIQYACSDYIAELDQYGILPSMSRPGCPYDNAMAESFMKTLKQEEVDGRSYRDLDHAKEAMFDFLEAVYNRKRLHSALGYRPPLEFEAEFADHDCGAAQHPSHDLMQPCP